MNNLQNFSFHTRIIFANSLFVFFSTYFFIKVAIAALRYTAIRYFFGLPEILHFEVVCTSSPFSSIWRYASVYTIYGVGVLFSLLLGGLFFLLLRYVKNYGVFKLFVLWGLILSLHHSLGFIVKAIIIKQDFYFVLVWLHLPHWGIYIVGFVSLVLYVICLHLLFFECIKISPSQTAIKTLGKKQRFFALHFVIVAMLGYIVIFSLQGFDVFLFELVEMALLLIPLSFAMIRTNNKSILIKKHSSIERLQYVFIILTILCGLAYIFK